MKGMLRNIETFIILIWAAFILMACSDKPVREDKVIKVFAASSLSDVLHELADSFQVSNNVKIQLNTASSGTLARQIAQGAEVDIYLSANKSWAEYIDSLGYFYQGSKTDVARNRLVLIRPKTPTDKLDTAFFVTYIPDLVGDGRISIGDPAHVPAGKYARQALEFFNVFEQVENSILPAKDVRSALLVVELKECPLGLVYKTDALRSEKVEVLTTFPELSHDPIVYTGGICRLNPDSELFFSYLQSAEAKEIWSKYGFQ